MGANSKSSSVAGAATLLLAIAAAITLASCMDLDTWIYMHKDLRYSLKMYQFGDIDATCETMNQNLIDGDKYSENPVDMLKQLKALSEETSDTKTQKEYYQRFYAKRLVSYAELKPQDVCGDIVVSEILQFLSMCGNVYKFKRYADFVDHYAPGKMAPCARKIIRDLDQKPNKRLDSILKSLARDEFLRAVLRVDGDSLTHAEMYQYVRMVNLDDRVFKSEKKLISDFISTLFNFRGFVQKDVKIVTVALELGAIREEELPPKFRLICAYFRLAAQIESWDAENLIKKNFRQRIDHSHSHYLDRKTIVWYEKPLRGKEEFLPDGNKFSEDPPTMLKQLETYIRQIDKRDVDGWKQFYNAVRLVSYSKVIEHDACMDLEPGEFLGFISMRHQHERYAKFVKHYAPDKFAQCARKIMEDSNGLFRAKYERILANLNKFSGAALGVRGEYLNDQAMYDHISKVNLAEVEFNIPVMYKLLGGGKISGTMEKWWKNLISNLKGNLYHFRLRVKREVNIVNLALGMGAIEEYELTPRFRLLNEYLNFAAQMADLGV